MIDTLVLLAAAAILPLLVLLFAFVGCEAHPAGEVPEAWVLIGPGGFDNIDLVVATLKFVDGQNEVIRKVSFKSPIKQTHSQRAWASSIDAQTNGELKSVRIICECELTPKLPITEKLTRNAEGNSIDMKRFELSGEQFAFNLDPIADI